MKSTRFRATLSVIAPLLILIALEEASQAFNPNRSFSIPDYLFSAAGVGTATLLYRLTSPKKPTAD